jgi:hypothetical protein
LSHFRGILGKGKLVADTVIIPRLRRVLTERKLALDELHRRLVARGDAPSRATLARMAQEKPIHTIRIDSVLPVMEELDVSFAALFETVTRSDWERRQTANGQAQLAARAVVGRRAGRRNREAIAEAETEAVIAGLEEDLRATSPELFDSRGRLRKRALVGQLAERFGGTTIEGDEVIRRINAARAARSGERAS